MPNVQVTSNVPSAGVDKAKAMAAISKGVATALGKSEQVVMVHLNLDTPMLFQASDAVGADATGSPLLHFNCMH
jgi:phenylpyruvate tautomerase PptA (4-oxalocrotonate tautomerase family)